jgi:methionyl-tRNA synthetase
LASGGDRRYPSAAEDPAVPERFYVTTPIYYVNDKPHLGHAYTTIVADVLSRWHRLRGREVTFLTGTDEHGLKVMQAAEARGLTPQAHADDLVVRFQKLWERLSITNDDFIRTTEPRHTKPVQTALQQLKEQGDLYEDFYEGWYSPTAERFWTEKDLVDGMCPETGKPVVWIKEKNWFFRMGKYADQLRKWIDDHPDWIQPETRKNEVLATLRKDVGDLCISRVKSRMSWGVPIPFDDEYVTYVWVDALLNYVTAIGWPDDEAKFLSRWPADVQLIGKDILTTHTLYWGTLLFALGLEPARVLFAHGWWTVEGRKMSKSFGNAIDPHLLIDSYGADATRYYLLKEIPFGADGDFSHKSFMVRYNADLANDLGNLAHRSLSMTEKWLGGTVPALDAPREADEALQALATSTVAAYTEEIEALQFNRAFETLWTLIRAGNKYIDSEEPWALNKKGDRERLGGVMRRTLEVLRIAALLLEPVMPTKMKELQEKVGAEARWTDQLATLSELRQGSRLTIGEPLFPRMMELPARIQEALAMAESDERNENAPAAPAETTPPSAEKTTDTGSIAIDDFQRIQLRSGRVIAAEKHPKADKLLVLKVDLGEPTPRQIVAGIAAKYAPDELVGRTVVVVANLKPAKLRGVESQGMLLAAGGQEVVGLVSLPEGVPPGTVVR